MNVIIDSQVLEVLTTAAAKWSVELNDIAESTMDGEEDARTEYRKEEEEIDWALEQAGKASKTTAND